MVYSPIASLEGISISSFPYDYKARRRTMSNPESVKYANSRMYFLEGTRVWSGSIDSLISDSSIDIAAKVVDIETFGNNLVIGTSKGLFVYDGANLREVNGAENIMTAKLQSAENGVYCLDTNGKLWLVFSYRTGEKDVQGFSVANGSEATEELTFDRNVIMTASGDSLYIASGKKVWRVGSRRSGQQQNGSVQIIWKGTYNFDIDVKHLFSFRDKLVVGFEEDQAELGSFFESNSGGSI